jgi:exodeoxyribonuclease VII large subunit
MVGTIELEADGQNLLIRFPYRPDLVEQVRTLPGRRWDKGQKVWRVPAAHAEAVYRIFSAHRFEFASEVSGLLAGTFRAATGTGEVAEAKTGKKSRKTATDGKQPSPETTTNALTVSQLNQRVQDTLRGAFPESVWVMGEVFGFDKNKDRKHLYFSLVEKAEGDSRAAAQVDVVMWAGSAGKILPRLAKEPDPLTLRDGIEIRALVRVELYVAKGRFQLIIEDIDPDFTLGKLALDREKILRELRDAGLDRVNSALPLPRPPLRIGVLSSPDAEGWNDFRRQLEESRIGFEVTLHPVVVQGEKLKATVLDGLSWFASRAEQFDALCIVRGGGSRTDLAWFDDREVAFAVARHPIKILCGIGHHRDRSVLDEIAHSEKTPTAVAAFLVQRVDDVLAELRDCSQRLREVAGELLHVRHTQLTAIAQDLRHHLQRRIVAARGHLQAGVRILRAVPIALLRDRVRAGLSRSVNRLAELALGQLERRRQQLQNWEQRQRLLDPRRVLARGYALVFGAGGKILPDTTHLKPGLDIELRMRDGRARTRVEEITEEA